MSLNYGELARLARKGRRAERRGKAIADIFTSLALHAIGALAGGWALMLAVGVIHAEWVRQLPTVGYWWAVLLVALLRGVFSRLPDSKSKD